jgi:ABC-type transporter Mla MlaB component
VEQRTTRTRPERSTRDAQVYDVTADRLVVVNGLDFDGRRQFLNDAGAIIARANAPIEVDCSVLTDVDDPTIGMLVQLARNAQRRGYAVTLNAPAARVLDRLAAAGVSDRFITRA